MKHIRYYISLIILATLVVACEEESNSRLVTSVTQMTFAANGGSQVFGIESNSDWKISSSADWLSVYPVAGSGSQSITVTVAIQDNKLEQEAKVVVMTADGSKVVNVSVKVEGSQVKTGRYLDLKVPEIKFSGKAKALDSLEITSNISWEVLGPEWLEAWDGDRWRPLSKERGVIRGNGPLKVYLRTSADNKSESSLEDVVITREYLTGDFSRTMEVSQAGRMQVLCTPAYYLEDGFTMGWHSGCDVAKIYFTVTNDKVENASGMSHELIRNTFSVTDESFINSATGLKPGSRFYIRAITEDAYGNMDNHVYTTYDDLPEETPPAVGIFFGTRDENGRWMFNVGTNLLTAGFHFHATNRANSAFMYNDPILWRLAMLNTNKKYWFQEGSLFIAPGRIFVDNLSENTGEIHAMACALQEIGGLSRPKMFRYDRYYDADGKRLPDKPLLDRIPKAMLNDPSLR